MRELMGKRKAKEARTNGETHPSFCFGPPRKNNPTTQTTPRHGHLREEPQRVLFHPFRLAPKRVHLTLARI